MTQSTPFRCLCLVALATLATLAAGCATVRPGDLSELLRSDPQVKTLDNQLALARLCERRGENDQARKIYEAVLAERPKQPQALHRLAVVCTKAGRYEEAQTLFDSAAEADPESAEICNDRGYLHLLQDEFAVAENSFRRATELKPGFTAAWTNLGLALAYQQKYEEAFATFLRAANSPAEAHCNLAYVYAQQQKLTEAQTHYRRALVHNPELKIAAEGLLQVSANLPGQEPRLIFSAVGQRPRSPDAMPVTTEGAESTSSAAFIGNVQPVSDAPSGTPTEMFPQPSPLVENATPNAGP